jgi:hypothetical protein
MALACALAGGAQPVRMLAGLTVPLALLAVQTIARRPRLLGSSVLALGLGGMLLPFLFIVVVRANAGRIFMPVAISRIGAYLAPRTTEHDVILAGYDVSNLLVGLTPARVVAGHGSQTVDLQSSGPIVRGYFTWPRTRRIQVEDRYHVTYVVVPLSRDTGLARDMAADARYARVYATGDYAVFRRSTRVSGTPPVREQFTW